MMAKETNVALEVPQLVEWIINLLKLDCLRRNKIVRFSMTKNLIL